MSLTEAELNRRLREVEHHLGEVPPHHGGGLHDGLQRQRADLQRQLSALRHEQNRESTSPRDPRSGAVRQPAARTPAAAVGAFRRTTHVAAGPAEGGDWGAGDDVARSMHAGCRDVIAGPGGPTVVQEVSLAASIADDHRLTSVAVRDHALGESTTVAGLTGQLAQPGLRRLVRDLVDDVASPMAAVLLDLGVGGTLSGYARLQAGRRSGKSSTEAMSPNALAVLGDSCRGWALDGDMVALLRTGVNNPPKPPPAVPEPDLDGWHDLGELPQGWMRRRRRVDVNEPTDDGQRIDAAFRDSWRDPEGIERALHEWELTLHLDRTGAIETADAIARSLPFDVCPSVTQNLGGLSGVSLDELRSRTREVLGGTAGCTHLNDLLSTIPAAVEAASRTR